MAGVEGGAEEADIVREVEELPGAGKEAGWKGGGKGAQEQQRDRGGEQDRKADGGAPESLSLIHICFPALQHSLPSDKSLTLLRGIRTDV